VLARGVRCWPKAADLGHAAKSSAYLGYFRRAANAVGTAGLDPELTRAVEQQALVYINVKRPAYSRQNGFRSSYSTSQRVSPMSRSDLSSISASCCRSRNRCRRV
jgi:hypothetical protein